MTEQEMIKRIQEKEEELRLELSENANWGTDVEDEEDERR